MRRVVAVVLASGLMAVGCSDGADAAPLPGVVAGWSYDVLFEAPNFELVGVRTEPWIESVLILDLASPVDPAGVEIVLDE